MPKGRPLLANRGTGRTLGRRTGAAGGANTEVVQSGVINHLDNAVTEFITSMKNAYGAFGVDGDARIRQQLKW